VLCFSYFVLCSLPECGGVSSSDDEARTWEFLISRDCIPKAPSQTGRKEPRNVGTDKKNGTKWNKTEHNGAEWNRIEQNGT